jgi:hypothetical protein
MGQYTIVVKVGGVQVQVFLIGLQVAPRKALEVGCRQLRPQIPLGAACFRDMLRSRNVLATSSTGSAIRKSAQSSTALTFPSWWIVQESAGNLVGALFALMRHLILASRLRIPATTYRTSTFQYFNGGLHEFISPAYSDFGPPREYKMAREVVEKEMTMAGYRLIRSHDILPWQYFLEFGL